MSVIRDQYQLELHLQGHCICTTAKNAVMRTMRTLLEEDPTDAETERLSSDLDLLQCFVRETDFETLRAKNPRLDGREDLRVRLCYQQATGDITLSILDHSKGDQTQ